MNDVMQTLALAEVNRMARAEFVAALGGSFEHSPWVAEAAWAARPFASVDMLHAAMLDVVRKAPRERRVAFLCAHPELAGKEAEAGTMTSDSTAEQSSAGLNALSRAEIGEIKQLNTRYREHHGFPFIIAVRRYDKAGIFAELRRRSEGNTERELEEALAQIGTITRLRIGTLVADATA
jgi:2-oxo-4-hydroxy-4-carboxy-5-ureidoimidazoline decarboxylase